MTTSLTRDATTLDLHDDLLWRDEFEWAPVAQRTQYTVTGALVIEAAAKQAGRPITLAGGETWAWLPRSTVLTLLGWCALPGQTFTLAHNGTSYSVVFDHERGALEAAPVVDYASPQAADFYIVTLRFIEV